jgi:hypothetical protein
MPIDAMSDIFLSSAATAKPKETKGMKQQGLMGFFGEI